MKAEGTTYTWTISLPQFHFSLILNNKKLGQSEHQNWVRGNHSLWLIFALHWVKRKIRAILRQWKHLRRSLPKLQMESVLKESKDGRLSGKGKRMIKVSTMLLLWILALWNFRPQFTTEKTLKSTKKRNKSDKKGSTITILPYKPRSYNSRSLLLTTIGKWVE